MGRNDGHSAGLCVHGRKDWCGRRAKEQNGQAAQRWQGKVSAVTTAWPQGRKQNARGEAGVWVFGVEDDQQVGHMGLSGFKRFQASTMPSLRTGWPSR